MSSDEVQKNLLGPGTGTLSEHQVNLVKQMSEPADLKTLLDLCFHGNAQMPFVSSQKTTPRSSNQHFILRERKTDLSNHIALENKQL